MPEVCTISCDGSDRCGYIVFANRLEQSGNAEIRQRALCCFMKTTQGWKFNSGNHTITARYNIGTSRKVIQSLRYSLPVVDKLFPNRCGSHRNC
ncbi:hypothetical protein AVEN_67074-1 [Araneus ventricosus]|uniref:Uncharacterized protein n=1 Tax=Araneus ventricosus TaxID=182803 RepID=A0A4Y2LGK8_ARAVE|nr:hypothetical protein AVEN_67074-1 [Araneus ventricosus]